VTGRFQKTQHEVTKSYFVTFLNCPMLKCNTRLLPENYGCAGAGCEFLVPADKVGVKMSLDNVFDGELSSCRFVNVFINVTLRIDNRSLSIRTNQV